MTLPATDNFNRANENPATGWLRAYSGGSVGQVVSNRLQGVTSGVSGFCYWTADTPPNDQYSQCIAPVNGSESGGPGVRITLNTGVRDGYRYNISSKTLVKYVSGTATTLQTMTDTISNSAVYKLEAVGTSLKVYKNGTQLGTTVTDSSIASGRFGIFLNALTGIFDDWEGGNAGSTIVTADNSTQANASTSGAIGQEHLITAGNSTQASTSTSGAIVQTMIGDVLADNSVQVNSSSSGAIIQSQTVSANNSTQVNGSTSGAIVMTHTISANNCNQINSSSNGAIKQSQVLTAGNSIQINYSSSGRMILTPGFWYNDSNYAPSWSNETNAPLTWTPSPPITSSWS